MHTDDKQEALTIATDEPNVLELATAYTQTLTDLGWFLEGCRDSYNWRRNIWAGKSRDLRKHGSDAFPWDGAADSEAHVISQRIDTYIALFMSALSRANIRANPTESGDIARAKVTSNFLKWMLSSYIPGFKKQMELGANHLLERGIMITHVGWEREDRTFKQRLNLEELALISPDLARIILEKSDDANLIEMLKQQFRGMTDSKAKRVLNDLRKKGEAEFPIVRRTVDRPYVESLSPDSDWFFPAYTTDPQRAPYCFWRTMMTAQELRNKVATEGWDSDWVEYVIKHCAGEREQMVNSSNQTRVGQLEFTGAAQEDLYEIIYAYQRLTDLEDNSEGIYCTVFHATAISRPGKSTGAPPYAKHELLNGYDDYPVVVTKLSEDDKKLYEVITIPEKLRGTQWQVKVERDSRSDRNSLTTLPPVLHPIGRPPPDMGPNVKIPYQRMGEITFGPTPPYNQGSLELEKTMLEEADGIMGLQLENPLSTQRQQYLITKFLEHVRDVVKLAFKCFQRFGPDEIFFRVTGVPDQQQLTKGNPNEDFDIEITFDVLNNDPETMESRLNAVASLFQFDKNGRISPDAFLEFGMSAIDPIMADKLLLPAEAASEQIVKYVTDDLSKIFAGIEVGARPNGAQVALQIIQQYVQQPDVMQRVQADEAFRERLTKYQQQYAMAITQAQNAQIGRIGTQPAAVGNISTQAMPA